MTIPHPVEPWRVKTVEAIRQTDRAYREHALREAGWNPTLLRSEDVAVDLFTDSGTSAMSDRQWAVLMQGDEAYAGARSFYLLRQEVRAHYGFEHVVPVHQGRAGENIVSQLLIRPGHHVAGNMYFTSTRAHQERNGAVFHDVIIDEAHDPTSEHPFKGDVDPAKLRAFIKKHGPDAIPYLSIGATVNMAGGQPISLASLATVREIADAHSLPVVLDTARAVENAYFIKQRESGWADTSIADILRAMCDLADVAIMSAKKDSMVNIGGWIGIRDPDLAERARALVLLYEGLHTYGGMAGRDMEALAQGIVESVREENIAARIGQVAYLGHRLIDAGVPVVRPIGGHCVCVDALATLPHISREEFPAQTLVAALYADTGIRGVERGALSAGRDPVTGENRYPPLEFVRLAIPRRVYTQTHMDVVADSVIRLHTRREQIVRGLEFTHEPPHLRFFQARFRPLGGDSIFDSDTV
ncbi:tryptophanase [Streptomyces sp. NPDC127068]|uniref:tryptophanase n=1 Tax=Streptomyces sp. NPDC127068 TaxID=3347127 RepID=UPI0036651610